MEIKMLKRDEIRYVYHHYLKKDFARNELRPLDKIESYLDKNHYVCMGLYKNDQLLSVAFMYKVGKICLLDYLDTLTQRGQGYGTKLIRELSNLEIDAIYVEVESVQNEDELQIKRQNFYYKNGFRDTYQRVKLYFVDYDILYLPIKKNYEKESIVSIYEAMYPTLFQKMFIKIKK